MEDLKRRNLPKIFLTFGLNSEKYEMLIKIIIFKRYSLIIIQKSGILKLIINALNNFNFMIINNKLIKKSKPN
jgi:hypothetical protein